MRRYVEGQGPKKSARFTDQPDYWIHAHCRARVVDVFINQLDLPKLRLQRADPVLTGRPEYCVGAAAKQL